jgi:hypothetical protein
VPCLRFSATGLGFDNAGLNARNGKRELLTRCLGVVDKDESAAGHVGCLAGG